ncbi:hypothetical protein F511_28456 [Dorcoceras hygrometricum]|uniref:Reverse transcriptase zinc-binding domain-containing protein n=1 Tax=Dorcoceras hygrometricum TaxID=472368 RepID=A0A2Z7B6F5_9LAMI|nr:hypothetical protein F511_28456 [Dorcoceras hygrometricum]
MTLGIWQDSKLIRSRLAFTWQKKTLSYAGKMELIRSVLHGVECFWLSILRIPYYVIDKIYTMCMGFLQNSKHPPIAWDMCCKLKEDGVLGLRNLRYWNKVLLAKSLWNSHDKKDSLWVKWIHHICGDNIWNWSSKKEDSGLIKKLLLIRDDIVNLTGS